MCGTCFDCVFKIEIKWKRFKNIVILHKTSVYSK